MASYPDKFPHSQYGLTFGSRSDWVQYLKTKVEEQARAKGLPLGVMSGIVEQESSWGAGATGKNKNGSTDAGLTQINSGNWPSYGVKPADELTRDPLNPIDIGTDILSKNVRARNGDITLAVADYNQGPTATNSQLASKKPPSAAVQKYITNVMFRSTKYGAPYPSAGDIQQLKTKLGFTPDMKTATKAAGVHAGMLPAGVSDGPLPTLQLPDDAVHAQQIAEAEQAAKQQQLAVEQQTAAANAAPADQSLAVQPPAPTAQPQAANQDLTIPDVEQNLPEPEDTRTIDERLAAAFGASPTQHNTSGLPKFVDSIVDEALTA